MRIALNVFGIVDAFVDATSQVFDETTEDSIVDLSDLKIRMKMESCVKQSS